MLLANPTFSQKIVLTSYAETSSAVAMGSAVVVGWLMCEALIEGEDEKAKKLRMANGCFIGAAYKSETGDNGSSSFSFAGNFFSCNPR